MLLDPEALQHTAHTVAAAIDHSAWLSHVANGLADNSVTAAAADAATTVQAAATEATKEGWFAKFVNTIADTITGINGMYNSAGITNAYGLSIVTFTVGIKTILLPLNYIQLESAEKMKLIVPVQQKIATLYPNDKQMQSAIVTRLYQQVHYTYVR